MLPKNTLSQCRKRSIEELMDITDVISELLRLPTVIPNVVRVFIIAVPITVTNASCTRPFSTLKRVKTYLSQPWGYND